MRRLSTRFFIAAALVLCLGILGLLARAVLTLRAEQWQHARQTNAMLAHTLEQNIARTIDGFDRSLVGVVSSLERFDTRDMAPMLRSALLFDHSLRSRGLGEVLVLDQKGDVVIESGSLVPRTLNFADRDYFRVHMRENFRGLYVGAPLKARLSGGVLSLPLSRAYYRADGSIAGVVVGTIRIGYFEELFASVDLGPSSRLVLWREDGTVLASHPSEGMQPPRLSAAHLARMREGEPGGTFTNSRHDQQGPALLHAFRRLGDYPLIVSVDQPVRTIVARWRGGALMLGLLALVLIAASLALTWAFLRELARRQAISAQLQRAEHDLRTILNNLPSRVGYWDANLLNRFANDGYRQLLGTTAQALATVRLPDLLGDKDYGAIAAHVQQALQGRRQAYELARAGADGQLRHLRCTLVPDRDAASQQVEGFFVQIDDLTERKHMEDLLFEEKERARLTLQSIGDAVLCTDNAGHITYINPAAEELTGWQSFDAAGRAVEDIAVLAPPPGPPLAADRAHPMREALLRGHGHGPQRGQVLHRRDGRQVEVEETTRAIHDREGHTTGAVMVLRDVTLAMQLSRRLEHLVQHDALTGLPNRVALQERAEQALALAARTGHPLALMYLDLDGFKQVNDSLGHSAGDLLLVQVARRFVQAVRASDTVCRQGGDEFIVLLPLLGNALQAEAVARKLLGACALPFVLDGSLAHVGLSGGLALYPSHGTTFEELAHNADAALYNAKRHGRGRIFICSGTGQQSQLLASGAQP